MMNTTKETTDAMTLMHEIHPDDSHWWGFAALPDELDYPFNGEDNPLTLSFRQIGLREYGGFATRRTALLFIGGW